MDEDAGSVATTVMITGIVGVDVCPVNVQYTVSVVDVAGFPRTWIV